MDLPILITWLLNNPEGPLLPPWERAYDLSSGLIYYRNRRTSLTIFDLRPSINMGGGILIDNYKWSCVGNRPISFPSLVVQPLSLTVRLHKVINLSRFYLFRALCNLVPIHLIVSHPPFQCPFCRCFIPLM